MSYLLHLLTLIVIYSVLGASLNLMVGYAGLLSLAHAVFYGIGAYTSALLATKLGWSPFLGLGAAVVVATTIAALASALFLRFRDDYFILATLGLQIITHGILHNWVSLTNGPFGIYGIPRPKLAGFSFTSNVSYFVLTLAIAILILWALHRLVESPFGRTLRAIRDDEVPALILGKNVGHYKILASAAAGGMAALIGGLYAHYIRYIGPDTFTLGESIFIFTIVIIGGSGNWWGSILGAAILILLPEGLRFVGLPSAVAGPVQQMIFGLLLMVLMLYRPQGFVGRYRFE